MRLLAGGATTVIVTLVSLTANAADLNYPSPLVVQPQYDMASPPPAVAPPQVIIVPGPTMSPQYNSATVPPPERYSASTQANGSGITRASEAILSQHRNRQS
jgi:hypothetical protein